MALVHIFFKPLKMCEKLLSYLYRNVKIKGIFGVLGALGIFWVVRSLSTFNNNLKKVKIYDYLKLLRPPRGGL